MTRARKLFAEIGFYRAAVFLIWIVIGSVVGWFVNLPGSMGPPAREGQECGPGYRWTRVGPAIDPDLSCESE
jgi:hypothetical protein